MIEKKNAELHQILLRVMRAVKKLNLFTAFKQHWFSVLVLYRDHMTSPSYNEIVRKRSVSKSMAHKQRNLRETSRKQSGDWSAQVVEQEEVRKDAD